jgi:hypothetical protein
MRGGRGARRFGDNIQCRTITTSPLGFPRIRRLDRSTLHVIVPTRRHSRDGTVPEAAEPRLAQAHVGHAVELVGRQREVEDVHVCAHVPLAVAAEDGHDALLQRPPQQDLRDGLVVCTRHRRQRRLAPLGERTERPVTTDADPVRPAVCIRRPVGLSRRAVGRG